MHHTNQELRNLDDLSLKRSSFLEIGNPLKGVSKDRHNKKNTSARGHDDREYIPRLIF